MTQSSNHVHTIVIGAGISGIKAAVDLHSHSIDTLILEGRDRIGGRLHTYQSPVTQRKYDIGASWFHELGFNPLFEKSLALGNVSYVFDDTSASVIGPEGEIPPSYKLGQVVNEMKLFASKEKDDGVNLHTLSNQYIVKHKNVLTKEQIEYAPQLLRTAEIMAGSWDLSDGSKSNLPYGGRDLFVLNHYETVLENELKGYPTDKIKTSTAVKSIEKGKVIKIETEGGEFYTCDYCIVTVPQSVLTLPDSIKFSPELPKSITSNFDKLATTTLAKVVFEFEAPFWNKDTEKFIFIGKPDSEFSEKVLKNEITTADRIPNVEFNKATEQAPKPWEFPFLCVNLQSVKGVPSLLCLIPSPVSIYLERAKPAEIWEIFKPLFGKLGEVADPVNIFTTNWNDDPFSRGSVSSIKANGLFVNDGFIEGWDNVRFAGEHTAYEGHGCVHGAWLSGKREADYVIEHFK